MDLHVAERILNEMIAAEPGIQLCTHHELREARTEANCIVEFELMNRRANERMEIRWVPGGTCK